MMTMPAVSIERLDPRHLEGFERCNPMGPMPGEQWGQALAFIKDGEVMGVAGAWENGGAVEIGLMLATWARRYPVTLHRTALLMLKGLDKTGVKVLRAWPVDMKGAEWLRRLGFEPVNSGAFERWSP